MALTGLANDTTVNLLGEVTFGVRFIIFSCFLLQPLKVRIGTGQDHFSRLEHRTLPESSLSMVADIS